MRGGVQDPQWVAEETEYKRQVIAGAQPLLAQPVLEEFLDEGQWQPKANPFKVGGTMIRVLAFEIDGDLKTAGQRFCSELLQPSE